MSGRAAIVPSLGASPIQGEMLARLRAELADLDAPARLVWVLQGDAPPPDLSGGNERLLQLPRPAGFAAAVNAGFAAGGEADFVAVVNDDVLLERGWWRALEGELDRRGDDAAAAQGVNLSLVRSEEVDGCGLAWNDDWQAVQIGHGGSPPATGAAPFEIFGASATAALYRGAALSAVARPTASLFDERLGSYYEDVELAVRLRQAGFSSWCAPAGRALHHGQATASRAPRERWRQIYRNRRWVAAELLGERFGDELARIRWRDRRDLVRRLLAFDVAAVSGIVAGTREAARQPAALGGRGAAVARPAGESALAAAIRLRVGSPA